DTVSYALSAATKAVTVNLLTGLGSGNDATGDKYINIENVIGGAGNDVITGDNNANLLMGGAGNDTLSGGNGDDTLPGGAGADSLNGGAGNDVYAYTDGDGADTFGGFVHGSDKIDLSGVVGVSKFSDLTIIGTTNAQIVFGGIGQSITVTGVAPATLDAN